MNRIIFENTSNEAQVIVSGTVTLSQSVQLQPGRFLKQEAVQTFFTPAEVMTKQNPSQPSTGTSSSWSFNGEKAVK